MIKEFKKWLFWLIALQRRNILGKCLVNISTSILSALDNKINDANFSGEYRFLESLDNSKINIVFDVGANVGIWSTKIKSLKSNIEIHAFEPVPQTFKLLEHQLSSFQSVKTNRIALSDKKGLISFNYYPMSSYLSSHFENTLGVNSLKIEVETITGDEYCRDNSIHEIDFLKIDTEGFESNVLKGFNQMLKENKIRIIQFEYGQMAIDSNFLLKDFFKFFEDRGYKVGKIFPKWIDFSPYTKEKENFVLSNYVAILVSDQGIFNLQKKNRL
ncbi:FkbM family methyltransferase [Algoriphagus aquimarinus]|uniref:Methyltransferase, FkbM family n=1 Tax=Algoriphagus aquimarinus TaxID=237018 RepID=A0A1I1CHG9_9BACT|nr:FkbM family methyltransferase [Algoriphagus aquimarinus]SFB60110.1 methyltransferase, FkbM family [Algoriphagus aquimarinus]